MAPTWSLDGRSVAINSDRDGKSDLYLLDIAASRAGHVNSRQLLFSALETSVDEVFRIGRGGSGLVRLTKGWEGVR